MLLLFISVFLVCVWLYLKWRNSYWNRRGVFQIEARPLFSKVSSAETMLKQYARAKSLNHKYGGTYFLYVPVFIPIDPIIIKNILQRDFIHFHGHGTYHQPKDVLSMNLFNLDGESWKRLRAKLTPTFTSGKMKMMFDTLLEKTTGLKKVVGEYADSGQTCAIKDILARFTTDVIGSCAFGIECNSLEEPNNDFRKYGKKAFEPNIRKFLKVFLIPHWILAKTGYKFSGEDVTEFFTNMVKETIRYRETNNIYRKDFMQLLLEIRNQKETMDRVLTTNEIIAQCYVFFLAGFETSSTAITFALLELSRNLDVQEKLRREILQVLNEYNGTLCYEAVGDMKYLDMVVQETLRKFPPAASIPRVCSKRYKVPDSDLVIEKGVRVQIPVWGLHMDPEYYPDPEVFNPENFSEENRNKRPDFTFLPFGEGPRMCIGMRFGLLQTKVGLISLIRNFHFTLNEKTKTPLEMERGSIVLVAKGDIWLNVKRI
ncbi:putative cytochrome P450 6a17 isoform X1 [Rhynchophorus ferrugineus]|uniref:putative cytochrome P450 6a17 isoform X1 n=1 Tax=Rhynchophorus ferrugineus TaxID=354439 RepID=UPI003FCD0238